MTAPHNVFHNDIKNAFALGYGRAMNDLERAILGWRYSDEAQIIEWLGVVFVFDPKGEEDRVEAHTASRRYVPWATEADKWIEA